VRLSNLERENQSVRQRQTPGDLLEKDFGTWDFLVCGSSPLTRLENVIVERHEVPVAMHDLGDIGTDISIRGRFTSDAQEGSSSDALETVNTRQKGSLQESVKERQESVKERKILRSRNIFSKRF
jgi:hypothetical protein